MKEVMPKQFAGLWIDNTKAILISKNEEGDYAITEKIKATEHHGGGSEHSMNNSRQSENLKYFKNIAQLLQSYDSILIFGSGKSQEQLQNFLKEETAFGHKKITIDSDENLTDPQMISKVRDFFKSHS